MQPWTDFCFDTLVLFIFYWIMAWCSLCRRRYIRIFILQPYQEMPLCLIRHTLIYPACKKLDTLREHLSNFPCTFIL